MPQKVPVYSLLQNQCYWFTNVLFDVLWKIFPKGSVPTPVPASHPQVLLPIDYLPSKAGRWMGILINDPCIVGAVVLIVKLEFEKQCKKYLSRVSFN